METLDQTSAQSLSSSAVQVKRQLLLTNLNTEEPLPPLEERGRGGKESDEPLDDPPFFRLA